MITRHTVKLTILAATVVLAAGAVLLFGLSRPPEPSYKGKRLQLLLAGYNGPNRNPEAKEALHALGSNAVPTLISMLRARDSALMLRSLALAQKLRLMKTSTRVSDWNRNWSAAFQG